MGGEWACDYVCVCVSSPSPPFLSQASAAQHKAEVESLRARVAELCCDKDNSLVSLAALQRYHHCDLRLPVCSSQCVCVRACCCSELAAAREQAKAADVTAADCSEALKKSRAELAMLKTSMKTVAEASTKRSDVDRQAADTTHVTEIAEWKKKVAKVCGASESPL